MPRNILLISLFFQMCSLIEPRESFNRVVEFVKDTSNLKEHLLLTSNTEVILSCTQPKGETVNIIQRDSNDIKSEKHIVINSVLNTQFLEEYDYTFNAYGIHNLTILHLSTVYNGYIFNCVSRPSGNELTLKLVVLNPPRCECTFEDPIFFTDDQGKLFQITCVLKTNLPFLRMNIGNSLIRDHLQVTKTSNNTHKTVSLEMIVDKSWNDSEFYCSISLDHEYRSGIADESRDNLACYFGPIRFYEKLQPSLVKSPVTYFDEGDNITFLCESNIPIANKTWYVKTYPENGLDIVRKESGDTLSLHIKSVVQNIQTCRIEANCMISFRERLVSKKFEAEFRKKESSYIRKDDGTGSHSKSDRSLSLITIALVAVGCTTLLYLCLGNHHQMPP